METIKADLRKEEEKYFIDILFDTTISIPISDDDHNEVKSAFNLLIEQLKGRAFSIELNETDKDLFYHVAVEYLEQLNSELCSVHQEMEQYGFLNDAPQEQ
ncbi:TPA: hypothetical protein ACPJ1X_000145 [Vibrio alginolyticus]|uniref:hypothetical protein n=1 Tax=Vibrio parahaemolyticus TaxID=670 RepID=UPI000B78C6D3|nr:hypothetical protein [Vibrio parahaemolyticus]EGQ8135229.1 hypothetical protein [Vibrio parahaemolyticus]EGQ8150723.1 hypothetical protein [Vibrio parahaemolyticus]EGQ8249860.1 hypothetical protein [Vibrio parahaemolyticus]EGQ8267181.1 hypothetical protein [Vibrio parahaemolyticus]EGQ8271095.1 hypothetical protein [Vibrio parahaemolyticus]